GHAIGILGQRILGLGGSAMTAAALNSLARPGL
ncbi:MAG: precorrin-8X methylmutase, partial [Mesorhizobium sp.]